MPNKLELPSFTFPRRDLSPGAARLRRFVLRHHCGKEHLQEDLDCLANAFLEILHGADPKRALELSGRQNQGRNKRTDEEVERIEIRPVYEVEKLCRERGVTVTVAIQKVSESRGRRGSKDVLPYATLVNYRKKHLAYVRKEYEYWDLVHSE